MRKISNKFLVLIAVTLLFVPMITMAEDSNMMVTPSWYTTNSFVVLKWMIDGYKVILKWENVWIDNEKIIWYKVNLTTSDWTQKTISVWADKHMLENWDAKAWENKYQVIVMWADWELAKSQIIVLKMWANWGPDFSSTNWGDQVNKPMPVSTEQKSKFDDLKRSLEESLIYLSKSITKENIEEIKQKLENLRTEYVQKFKDAWANEDMIKKLNERFDMFYKYQIENRQKMMENNQKHEMKNENWDKNMKPQYWNWENKPNNGQAQWLQQRYKQLYAKKLETKLASLNTEQINAVIAKIDSLIEKYKSSTELSQEKIEKIVMQLKIIKEILNEKLSEMDTQINLDELFN